METAGQKTLRRRKELLESRLASLQTFQSLAKLSITLAFVSFIGSITLGPLGLIPESMAWLVGLFGTLVFGGVSFAILSYAEEMYTSDERNITKMRHAIEDATDEYFQSLVD